MKDSYAAADEGVDRSIRKPTRIFARNRGSRATPHSASHGSRPVNTVECDGENCNWTESRGGAKADL